MKEYTIVYDEKNYERKYIRYEAGIPIILSKDIVIDECNKEIERLNNIIKEVREYIENNLYGDYGYECKQSKKELLEILDKGE